MTAIANISALSLGCKFPTKASVMHSLINGYKNVLAVALATDYSFPLADKAKEYLKNPSAFAAAAAPAPAAAAPAAAAAGKKEAPAAKAPEPQEESEEEMGLGLFD